MTKQTVTLAALLLGLALGFAGARFWFADQSQQRVGQLQADYAAALAQNQSELVATQAGLDSLQGALAIEKSTRKALQTTLRDTQTQLGSARDKLAFYEQLLPPGPNGAISLRAFDLERRGPALHYRVLLMRNAPDDEPFRGILQFVAQGTRYGKNVQLELKPAQAAIVPAGDSPDLSRNNALMLSFDQFQRSTGLLSVPAGFIPESVTLNVLEGTTVRASRALSLPEPAPAGSVMPLP